MKWFIGFLFILAIILMKPANSQDARLVDLQKRWDDMSKIDAGMPGYFRAYPLAGPNSGQYFIEKILGANATNAETRMAKIEAEWALILQERVALAAAEAAAKAERQEIKTYLDTITNSDLPAWHKKILKVLIREMRD
jgi:hypothetical protein